MYPPFDLGSHVRKITTDSDEAQLWFDRGLNWSYGFNQEEGVTCFEKALEFDPECAMAHWGLAYAAGPFYNFPWGDFSAVELNQCTRLCFDHVNRALALSDRISPPEAALVNALCARFQANHPVTQEEFDGWDDDYADAMRKAHHQFPEDLDIAALFVEAMMTRTPWKLWNVITNQPAANADTLECLEVLENAMAQAAPRGRQHPAILHLHIHVLEMSGSPEQALVSADTLATMCPDAGHMNHMPGHIYVLCGQYDKAKTASEKAIRADRMYLDYAGPYNFYTTARCHDLHLMMYTCMFLGQFKSAMAAADEMCATLSPDVVDAKGRPQMSVTLEGYHAMKMHVLVRFGRWKQIIDTAMPEPAQLYCVSTSMHHYARTIAHATLGNFTEAEVEQSLFYETRERIPEQRKFFNNTAQEILAVAEQMMEGELQYHLGNYAVSFDHLRKSVQINDNLAYSEPWAWMHPPRHALGALLLEQGHHEEAESVYRADLGLDNSLQRCAQHPGNIWSLHGLAECLRQRGETTELTEITAQLDAAITRADTTITSSCCCRKNVA